jgi:integrase
MQLDKLCSLFLSDTRNAGTRKAYAQILRALCDTSQDGIGIGGEVFIQDITSLDMVAFWARVRAYHTPKGQPYSPYTLKKHLKSLRTFFNWCIKQRVISQSPAAGLKTTPTQDYIPKEKAMFDAEFQQLSEHAFHTSPRNYALLLFFADTGCREIAVRNLKLEDFNLEQRTAIVTTKNGVVKTVEFGAECQRALRYWFQVKPPASGRTAFREYPGDGLKEGVLSQVITRMAQRVGLSRRQTSHMLRHRLGHRMADANVPITVAAKVLGHASPDTTRVYYPDNDERAKRVARLLATPERAIEYGDKITPFPKDKHG